MGFSFNPSVLHKSFESRMLQSDVFPFKFEVIHKSEITTFEASGFVLKPGFY